MDKGRMRMDLFMDRHVKAMCYGGRAALAGSLQIKARASALILQG